MGLAKSGMRALLRTPGSTASWWPHAARQWAEGRHRAGMQLLGASLPKRPLVPFGTPVTVKRREWSRKTPFAPKAHNGVAVAPLQIHLVVPLFVRLILRPLMFASM